MPSRSDTEPGFLARSLRQGLAHLQIALLCIEPGSPGENGSVESFNGTFREEWLNRACFSTLREAQGASNAGGARTIRSGPTARGALGRQRPSPGPRIRCVHDSLRRWPNKWGEVSRDDRARRA